MTVGCHEPRRDCNGAWWRYPFAVQYTSTGERLPSSGLRRAAGSGPRVATRGLQSGIWNLEFGVWNFGRRVFPPPMLRINGEPIDPALLDEAFLRCKAEAEARSEVSCCERDDEFRARAEEEVIDGILLAQEAERTVPPPTADEIRPELEETLRRWREQGASWEMLEARRSELRAEVASKLRMDRFTAGVWADLTPPGEEELRAWYAAHAGEFRSVPEVHALHLLRRPGPDPAATFAELVELRARVLAGEDFATLARRHTDKPGGEIDLGWVRRERVLNPFEAVLFSLWPGETSPVLAYDQALHLVHAVATRPATVPPLEDVRAEVAARALAGQRRAALGALAARLRAEAIIER